MPKYLDIKPEDLKKVNNNRSNREAIVIDDYHLFIAEFGKHYGWGGVRAILDNEIDTDTATWLILAARKIDSRYAFSDARASLIGASSAQSKKPSQVFKKATADLVRDMKADI
jgi:hypothetical protein